MVSGLQPRDVWIEHVFDHAVSDPSWYSGSDPMKTFDEWPEAPETIATHIAETFEHAGELLSRFSNEQLNQGFWYLFYPHPRGFMAALLDQSVDVTIRLRALRSFVPLFEQVMAVRCSSRLESFDEECENPLNTACFMWFDTLLDRFQPQRLAQAKLDDELEIALRAILAIPHDACRESALHGISHWVLHYPKLADLIDRFLSSTPGLRPELVTYAGYARAGKVL
jgi:hypothetical protein